MSLEMPVAELKKSPKDILIPDDITQLPLPEDFPSLSDIYAALKKAGQESPIGAQEKLARNKKIEYLELLRRECPETKARLTEDMIDHAKAKVETASSNTTPKLSSPEKDFPRWWSFK